MDTSLPPVRDLRTHTPGPASTPPRRAGGGAAALLAAFAVAAMLSTALTNVLAAALCVAAGVAWARQRPTHLLRHPLCLALLGFLAWVVVRDLLAGAALSTALASAWTFRVLGFVVLWAPLLPAPGREAVVARALLWTLSGYAAIVLAWLAATGVLLYPTVPAVWEAAARLPAWLSLPFATLVNHAPGLYGPVLLLAIFGGLQCALDRRGPRAWLLAFALLATAALFLAGARRTTQLGFFLCAAVFLLHNRKRLDRRMLAGAMALGALVLAGLTFGPARNGLEQALDGAVQRLAPSASSQAAPPTSESERLHFWTVARGVIAQSPWIGTSVARWRDRYLEVDATVPGEAPTHGNPHSEYLYVAGTLGAVGLALYLALHAQAWRATSGDALRRALLGYYLVAMLSNIAVNSYVIDMEAGHLHALVLLMLCGPGIHRRGRA